jgi:general secretion pathway protein J
MTLPKNGAVAGFTLVELLVALFISAVVSAMGYGAITQALKNKDAIEQQQNRLLEVQTTLRMLAQDLGQVIPRPVREPFGNRWEAAFVAATARAEENSQQQILLSFTRNGWANPAGIARPALQRVSYVMHEGVLRREHSAVLDTTQGSPRSSRDLLKNVRSISLRYLGPDYEWLEIWPPPNLSVPGGGGAQPSAAERVRPLGVEIKLELTDMGTLTRIIELSQ